MSVPVLSGQLPEHPLLLSIDLRSGRITATGELDRLVAHRISDALLALSTTAHRTWTVDAGGVTFCDAEGLRAIAAGAALARERGCALRVVAASPFLVRLMRLTGVSGLAEQPAGRPHRDAGPGRRVTAVT